MPLCLGIRSWLRDYDRIQAYAVRLIYVQIGCALVGSLGALFNGVSLINLAVAFFALIAIENSSQRLGRTYAVLLLCAIVLDISWFILFSHTIWKFASEKYGELFVFSIRLTLVMQIIGFSVRFFSSFLWIQMYRLGASIVSSTVTQEADFYARNSFLSPRTNDISRQSSVSDNDILGNSIYNRPYFSPLFEDAQNSVPDQDGNHISGSNCRSESAIRTGAPQLKLSIDRQFQLIQADTALHQPLIQ